MGPPCVTRDTELTQDMGSSRRTHGRTLLAATPGILLFTWTVQRQIQGLKIPEAG